MGRLTPSGMRESAGMSAMDGKSASPPHFDSRDADGSAMRCCRRLIYIADIGEGDARFDAARPAAYDASTFTISRGAAGVSCRPRRRPPASYLHL